jgi:HAD superfamily hydrolase (TIGR01662 family)
MTSGEIVLLMGPPGGGKSTKVREFVGKGYHRLNRDEIGSTDLMYRKLRQDHSNGVRLFVLDNTYGTQSARYEVISLGLSLKLSVRAVLMETTQEQAQFFAARRQIQRYGKLLRAADYKQAPHKTDPNDFPPVAQFAYFKKREDPHVGEGLVSVERVPVKIDLGPEYTREAVILDYDGTLRDTISGRKYPNEPKDIRILPGRKEKLDALVKQGLLLLGASNQSGCSKEPGDEKYVSVENAQQCIDATNQMLGHKIDAIFSTEAAGVPPSFWPKPCPGMGVHFIEKYKLNPAKVTMVGDRGTDRTFATRCGFQYADAEEFFR